MLFARFPELVHKDLCQRFRRFWTCDSAPSGGPKSYGGDDRAHPRIATEINDPPEPGPGRAPESPIKANCSQIRVIDHAGLDGGGDLELSLGYPRGGSRQDQIPGVHIRHLVMGGLSQDLQADGRTTGK